MYAAVKLRGQSRMHAAVKLRGQSTMYAAVKLQGQSRMHATVKLLTFFYQNASRHFRSRINHAGKNNQ